MAHCLPATLAEQLGLECDSTRSHLSLLVCDPQAVYRPRHPERTVFHQTFEQHFDSYVRLYEERFEPRSGPLRRVVPETVEQFLACGRLPGG
jgi:hypothetical protein